jgi:uncharacterized membrane protein
MTRDAAMAHLDTYLAQVRRHLKGLSEAETREVLLELRAHVLDRVEGNITPKSVEAAITALGAPRDVGLANVTERVAAVMEKNRGFFGVLAAVVRLASLSVAGFVVFMVSLFGYSISAGLLLVAVMKPIAPANTGMWVGNGSYSLGVMDRAGEHAGAHEVMGWWIIPFGLIAGLAIGYLTWVFGRVAVQAMRRSGRRTRGLAVGAV